MRIVAGTYRSRIIKAVEGMQTRPTTDKVKEAVFSSIGPYFQGGRMLDLFGGSGNIGLEAISRGIAFVYFCDKSKKAIQTIRQNITSLGVNQQTCVLQMDYQECLRYCKQENLTFDFIYLDPPYKYGIINEILITIDCERLLNENGKIVCESDTALDAQQFQTFEQVKTKQYGITNISYFRGKKK